jgi:hypothetical protein
LSGQESGSQALGPQLGRGTSVTVSMEADPEGGRMCSTFAPPFGICYTAFPKQTHNNNLSVHYG